MGKIVFHQKQLTADGRLPALMTWYGDEFQITDVMGVFRIDKKNQIQKFVFKKGTPNEYYQDLSGHLVNDKGYLIDKKGCIVSR